MDKDLIFYSTDNTKKDKKQNICKECIKAKQQSLESKSLEKLRYLKNKEKIIEKSKQYQKTEKYCNWKTEYYKTEK